MSDPIHQFDAPTKAFYNFHGIQLLGSKFPVALIPKLYHKLCNKIYDAGDYFKIFDNPDKQTYEVHALTSIPKNSQVFLIDHALSFRYPQLRPLLDKNPHLIDRLQNMLKYCDKRIKLVEQPKPFHKEWIEFQGMGLSSIDCLTIPENTLCLSLMYNDLADDKQIILLIQRLPHLKVLWLNDNPVAQSQYVRSYIFQKTQIQIFNSRFTTNVTDFGLQFATSRTLHLANKNEVYYLDLSDRDIWSIDHKLLTEYANLRRLNIKGHNAQTLQQLNKLICILQLPQLLKLQTDLQLQLTILELYQTNKLQKVNRNLIVNNHNIYEPVTSRVHNQIDSIHQRIFKRTNCYRLANTEQLDETSIWYVNDELGSSITHSDDPEVVLAPFLYAEDNQMTENVIAFTLMWNIKDLQESQVVERDYLSGLTEEKQRSSRLAVWYQLPHQYYLNLYNQYEQKMKNITDSAKLITFQQPSLKESSTKSPLKVLTDSPLITEFLTCKDFEFTRDYNEADILWIDQSIGDDKQFSEYSSKFINQFPFEACLVMKNNLANTIQDTLGNTPFLQRTYDLQTQLPIFLGHFFTNQQRQADNLWISKPPNMARSMDMLVSDNLDVLIRNMQTGPKLVQKYITYPVRRLNRKIDLRFIVMAKSILPLEVYLYKHFWIRTSNNEYNIDCRFREVYETHFTVMNYGKKLTQVHYPDFIDQFNKDYAPVHWEQIQNKINQLLRQTFKAAQIKHPQMHAANSRAVYGVDIMIDEVTMQPKLLQFTFAPDCNRACKFYPTFYNDLFEVMFLNRSNPNLVPLFN